MKIQLLILAALMLSGATSAQQAQQKPIRVQVYWSFPGNDISFQAVRAFAARLGSTTRYSVDDISPELNVGIVCSTGFSKGRNNLNYVCTSTVTLNYLSITNVVLDRAGGMVIGTQLNAVVNHLFRFFTNNTRAQDLSEKEAKMQKEIGASARAFGLLPGTDSPKN
ncbi:MAG TPA: hypothetical protein VEJ67_00570 [Candidatus Cybelea sp.]|nr:hypothetical protein [Candidatus Cybelea sp.]